MVYVYKKKVGDKIYYYLRASKRKGNKVMARDIAYLGSSIEEVKRALEKLPKYSEQIRKAYKTISNFLESNRFMERVKVLKLKQDPFLRDKLIGIEACKLHYDGVFKKSPVLTQKDLIKNFIIEFAFNTTSIEGNTIKLEEARELLEENLTPKNKTLREIYDLQNTERVIFKLLESKEELSHEQIIEVHKGLMQDIDARIGYRTRDVRVIRSNFEATPAPYVKTDMDILLKWYRENKSKLHPFVLASIFHHKFEKIHPFFDGNGRTGRMILNYILMLNNYPLIIVHTKRRAKYLHALKAADKTGLREISKDYGLLTDFLADELTDGYWGIFL